MRVFECLSSGSRLDMYRLLVRQGPKGMFAGQIALSLDIPANTASFHLKVMTHAGLLSVKQEGRFQRYRADLSLMRELIEYLTDECCAGQTGQCVDLRTLSACSPGTPAPISSPAPGRTKP